jgi:hypothetical protein
MSRKTRTAQQQSQVLATIKPCRPEPVPDTTILQSLPPMNLREALLTDSKWVSLSEQIRQREAARAALQERLEYHEGCGSDFADFGGEE